ncbi:MAG: DnaB-like helicase N-terminal domain-containing protein [Pseudomonadota bacterium]
MKPQTTLALPADEYTERLVLGSLMLDSQQMDAMRTTLEPDDFSDGRHRSIWAACCAVYDTGATVEGCARALLKAGASCVDVAVVARVKEAANTTI